MTDDEIRDLFREMGEEPVPVESLRRLRLGVAARTQPVRRAMWRGAWVLAAAACFALVPVWLQRPVPIPRLALPVIAHHLPVPTKEAAPVPARPRQKAQASVHVVSRRTPQDERTRATAIDVIRIETPDPDVVILLISE